MSLPAACVSLGTDMSGWDGSVTERRIGLVLRLLLRESIK